MGFLNKIIKKSDKSLGKKVQSQKGQEAKVLEKKELTIAEIQSQGEGKSFKDGSKKSVKTTVKKDDTKDAYRVLIKPMVTEKGTFLASQNKYLFEVARSASKIAIKKAILALYGVTPQSINVVALSGKKVRYGKSRGRTKDRKKAIVTLAKGQSIEVYEGV